MCLRLVGLAAIVVATTACVIPARTTHLRLQVSIADDANDDRPIPVDVVFVWDGATAEKLEALPAREWFKQKTQLRQDDPAGRTFSVREWEWVPGQTVPDIELAVRPSARKWLRAIYVFADYRTDGAHRVKVEPGAASLALLKEELRVAPGGAASAPIAGPGN
jgi:type VI secretion system protein